MTLEDILAELRLQREGARHAETGMWVASVLRERIAAGQLAPGSKLSEEALGEALGVSRNTLREAFSALAAEHVVTRIPNRGVYVARPSADDIREIYRVRRYLEPAALAWSPATDVTPLRLAVERSRAAREAGSVTGMADANQAFHAGVVELAGSERLTLLMKQVLAEMRLVFHSMAADPVFHAPYVEDNARIVELLGAGQRAEAAELMADYLRRAEAQLLAAMAGNGA
ncbi:GntR family transcriptional regulator [Cryobacterium tagatosivorans]|uniref:GntR family transcriptional regulator n=1 Tax=Cryobacterium tagatosivorans TaxID=1259199 RepID=A0A4R8UHP4_9MICO|nr:GntR family transcriptional regulator [Cryobacterium tagatosivorans]TFB53267.1 GntR family transcriptional regulator [Cryobacterium tagatosivorans]